MEGRQGFLKRLYEASDAGEHVIGAVCGSGLTAKYVMAGGADFILALSSGIYRSMGRGSLGGLMPYANSNEMVAAFAKRELLPMTRDFPVFFGLNATDPTMEMTTYIKAIRNWGFTGINNYPTIGFYDGDFHDALEASGLCYEAEVQAIAYAHELGMATVAFAFNADQAKQMIRAGADVLCVHLGLTGGGLLGASKVFSLVAAKDKINAIFEVCDTLRPGILKMVYGGPLKDPVDVQYMYQNTQTHGYIGGSAFDRIPTEKALLNITQAFKSTQSFTEDTLMQKMLTGITKYYDYPAFVKEYIKQNYMNEIAFSDLARLCGVSRGHLSTRFKQEVGCTLQDYLLSYRMKKAASLLKRGVTVAEAGAMVGYPDVAHFSKMFKKTMGASPKTYKCH